MRLVSPPDSDHLERYPAEIGKLLTLSAMSNQNRALWQYGFPPLQAMEPLLYQYGVDVVFAGTASAAACVAHCCVWSALNPCCICQVMCTLTSVPTDSTTTVRTLVDQL